MTVTDADRTKARVVTRWWADDTSEVQMQEDIAAAIAAARTPSADVKAAVATLDRFINRDAELKAWKIGGNIIEARATLVAAGLLEA